ncbi:uncharacterized protein LOC110861403 [Folsomia candida]|uniref:Poly(3-hydroxyalkanoate) depolymerase C n=1 Tax=Folsomia candida TaxID=158441 RepID=A0A226D0E1_FOLCA|nr:uncharacterized protein LOC110861403 [Folsomia candida]XP_021966201.1 uncharacterized protein LOC110861403 [Folsomia candida]OXA39042.1 hypothetical protein Fcan01_26166 [Folsomia candida]
MRKFVCSVYVLLYLGHVATGQIIKKSDATSLEKYNVDPDSITVSGFASGGSFATQFHFSYSSLIKGAGIFAGYGPYLCGYEGVESMLSCIRDPNLVNMANLLQMVDNFSSSHKIDDITNLNGSRAYVIGGTRNLVVNQGSLRLLSGMYKHFGANVLDQFSIPVGHGIPVNNGRGAVCSAIAPWSTGYLNECGLNSVFQMLNWLYGGTLATPRAGIQMTGRLIPFPQSDFIKGSAHEISRAMGGNGHIYVPIACLPENRVTCRLHVVFRECSVGPDPLKRFEEEQKLIAQYAEVADLNNIIMLHPSLELMLVPTFMAPGKQQYNDCWDSFGFTGQSNYATKDGAQASVVYRMIQRVLGEF